MEGNEREDKGRRRGEGKEGRCKKEEGRRRGGRREEEGKREEERRGKEKGKRRGEVKRRGRGGEGRRGEERRGEEKKRKYKTASITLPLTVLTHHTFLLDDINACVYKILKLKVSLVLGICCPQVEWEILQGEGETSVNTRL